VRVTQKLRLSTVSFLSVYLSSVTSVHFVSGVMQVKIYVCDVVSECPHAEQAEKFA
jgi:hypothetical protein